MYRVHSVTILAEDCDKADVILEKHYRMGDIDEVSTEDRVDKNGDELVRFITYWIRPYIYDDFETIVNEFKQEGIRIK